MKIGLRLWLWKALSMCISCVTKLSDSKEIGGGGLYYWEKIMYHYQTVEEICVDDRIYYSEAFGEGYVSRILIPYSKDARNCGLPNGAVMLGFGENDTVVTLDKPEEEEDLEFISRKD